MEPQLQASVQSLGGSYQSEREASDAWNALDIFRQDSNCFTSIAMRVKLNSIEFDIGESVAEAVEKSTCLQKYSTSKELPLIDLVDDEKQINYVQKFLYKDGQFAETARNNLARLEHLRWNTFHLANGWTKLPKSKLGAETEGKTTIVTKEKFTVYNAIRKNIKLKKHACIITFEGLDLLWQKSKSLCIVAGATNSQADYAAEAIRYDHDVLDLIFEKALNGCKYKVVNCVEDNN